MATRVTQLEKEKMWKLYQKYGSIKEVAKKVKRNRNTVSRYVNEYEAAVNALCVVIDAQNT